MSIRIFIVFLFMGFGISSNAQMGVNAKNEKEQKSQLVMLAEKYMSTALHEYGNKPMYYLQVKKSDCRVSVRINDIPVYCDFSDDEIESQLYPVNAVLSRSGCHTFSVEVLPAGQQEYISEDASACIRILFLSDVNASETEATLVKELCLPGDLETQKLKCHRASDTLDVSLPFDYSDRLVKARDLRQVPNLEEMVVKQYNKLRQYLVNGDRLGYQKECLRSIVQIGDMIYFGKDQLINVICNDEGFDLNVSDRKVEPIEDYEMQIYGNGKLVQLKTKLSKDDVLQVSYRQKQETQVVETDEEGVVHVSFGEADGSVEEEYPVQVYLSIVLYMPENSDYLEIY